MSPAFARLRRAARGLRRDLAAATAGLRGETPPPFRPRDGAAWPAPRPREARRELVVQGVDRLTDDAVRLRLQARDGRPLPFTAGQFLTLCVQVDGQELRRAYSLCSDPARTDTVAVAVKAVPDGRVSPRLVHHTAPGEILEVMGPSGTFGHALDPAAARTHVMVAGGSGITPLVSLLHAVLATEPGSRAVLVYGNRRKRDRMLVDDLDALQARYGERLVVRYVLDRGYPGWQGGRGRLDAAGLQRQLDALDLVPGPEQRWYLCGPAPMLDACQGLLAAAGLPEDAVAVERFTAAPPPADAAAVALPDTPQPVVLRTARGDLPVTVAPGQTILDAARAAGHDLPFSCAMGGCGACRQTLVSGSVHMRRPHCLRSAEVDAGAVLTCVAHPLGPVVVELS